MKKSIWKSVWKIAKFIVIPVLFIMIIYRLYSFVDEVSNGVLLDWLDRELAYEYTGFDENGQTMLVHTVDWSTIKYYCLQVILFIVSICTVVFLFILEKRKRSSMQESAAQIAEYIDRFIVNDEPLPADIPSEYGEVFAKISEVKLREQKREAELLAETTRKDDLVTYLAHDLKTPLTSVIGYLTLLKDEPDISKEMRARYTDVAVNKSLRLEELINELFEITRYNIHKIELEKGNVNLSVMLEQILFEFEPLLVDKKLSFVKEINADIEAYVDVDKIERVIDNLIRNAIHYSYEDTDIKVNLGFAKKDTEDKTIRFVIENKGKTIPAEKLERIFEQFYRVDSSRSTTTGGSGLGLAIAKQLVEAHGGSIVAESENETIRFVVELP